ncbi:MAG: class I tRNA ligase family protein, partial [Candidatus Bathyarchaeia archaeon]
MFTPVEPHVDFPKLEHRVLKLWAEAEVFKRRKALNEGKPRWSFIDGPITANNPMGVHHAWGRTYKDLFQRYRAMRGFQLRYQNGFDCQGLWIEVELEKELGFRSKREIEEYGIAEFVKQCKQRVLRFAAKQTEQSVRLGYWMDWDDPKLLRELAEKLEKPEEIITVQTPSGRSLTGTVEQVVGQLGTPGLGGSYFTFSDENNYTIWAVLKRCHERGWIRKGRDVMPWCPRCSTALSEHEIATEGYRELTHLGLTVRFPLKERPGESLLVWTTTPWTLSSNVAVAVHPDISYVRVLVGGEALILAKAALPRTVTSEYRVLEEMDGMALQGLTYQGPYDDLPAVKEAKAAEAHRVLLWDQVSETEGTGIVHIAPGCGKEDFQLGSENGLPVIAPLDDFGVFLAGFSWLTGRHAYEVAQPVVEDLRRRGLLFKVESYTHRYPVCWRCESELVFRLVDEWFIQMGEKLDKPLEELTDEEKRGNLRYQIMESAKQVRWIPSFGLQQELDWLRNMGDWMISKKRYWGLALPIWECPRCGWFDVIGSEQELEARAVEGWESFKGHTPHRPWIDAVRIRCSRCGAVIPRIQDVGNPWLDAGIVAYSTLGYRHSKELWAKWFPADLICESLPGQFRNWFYSML